MAPFEPEFESLVQVFNSSVERHADRLLFGTKHQGRWRWMTYREFGDLARRMRTSLGNLGVEVGDRVAVISGNRPEWAVGAYATYGLGAAYVAMYESQLEKDWCYILEDCGAKVLFVVNQEIAARVRRFRDDLPALEHVILFSGTPASGEHAYRDLLGSAASPMVDPGPSAVADFIYTSGTTGDPKGVLLTHRNLAYNISAVHELLPIGPDDRSLSFLPWAHSFGQTCELHGGISIGMSLALAEAIDKLVSNLAEVRPTIFMSVPRVFNRIYDTLQQQMAEEGGLKSKLFHAAIETAQARSALAAEGKSHPWVELRFRVLDALVLSRVRAAFGGRLKYAFSGGAAISSEVAQFIDNLGITVYEGYGLSETSPMATVNSPGNHRIGSVGKPLPGLRIEIDLEAVDDPDQGEVIIYGHNVMKGYYKRDRENDEVLVEKDGMRGLRTGDIGRIDEAGFLHITGRVKEQYKLLNGKYVVPTPLEEKLKLSPYIANVMVYGDNREFNVGVVVPAFEALGTWANERGLDPNAEAITATQELRALIGEEITRLSSDFKNYERVKAFHLVREDFTTDNGMLTPTLKVKRRAVQERYGDAIEAMYAQSERAQPRSAVANPA